jgi:protein-tyrosine phosphatase
MKPNIYSIPGPWVGRLAIVGRPRGGDWLSDEVEAWRDAGVQVIVSLLSDEEVAELGLTDEERLVNTNGLRFIGFPIDDYDVPASANELRKLLKQLEELLNQGQNVAIHCRAGIGRSSLVAACLLVNQGKDTRDSFQQISSARGVAVPDTVAQREWVGEFARIAAGDPR